MSEHGFSPLSELKKLDQESYIACLYLPEETRDHAATIYLFDAEISRIPDLISEPMPGEIRLQFWRDTIAKGTVGDAGPLAEALLDAIDKNSLPKEVFHNYLNARIFDLYQDPMPDMGTFEGYLGEIHSAMLQMVALSAGLERGTMLADACGHAGMAIGISRLLAGHAWHHHNRRIYIPGDLLKRHGFDAETWLKAPSGGNHDNVISDMLDLARDHHAKALASIAVLPKKDRVVFLPLAFAEPLLRKVEHAGRDIFKHPVKISALRRQWAAFRWAAKV